MLEVATSNNKALVHWKGEAITITREDVTRFICPLATDQEVAIFLKTCQSLQLNPFAGECFLIKYDSREKAAFVIAIDSYLKAAETNPQYDGCEAGIILKDGSGKFEQREGAFLLDEDKARLAGGWAKIYRKDHSHPTYVAVNKNECIKLTREGKPTQFWAEPKQPWMLRKVALKRGMVEAFPSLFAGTLATAEIESDIEGELPAAFEKQGEPDWPKFWTKVQFELGVNDKEAHKLLGVASTKELLEQGKSMEDIWLLLVAKVQESKTTEAWPQPMDQDFEPLFDDTKPALDKAWLNESLKAIQWEGLGKWLKNNYPEAKGQTIGEAIESLTREQQEDFVKEVQKRLEAKAKS